MRRNNGRKIQRYAKKHLDIKLTALKCSSYKEVEKPFKRRRRFDVQLTSLSTLYIWFIADISTVQLYVYQFNSSREPIFSVK